jgi:hypothetical protein
VRLFATHHFRSSVAHAVFTKHGPGTVHCSVSAPQLYSATCPALGHRGVAGPMPVEMLRCSEQAMLFHDDPWQPSVAQHVRQHASADEAGYDDGSK